MSDHQWGEFYIREKPVFFPEAIVRIEPEGNLKEYPYDLVFDVKKDCRVFDNPIKSTIDHNGNKTKICQNCYYRAFARKMASLPIEERDEFLEYQIIMHKNPIDWLKACLLCTDYFKHNLNSLDYGLIPNWKKLINQQIFNLEEEAKPTSKKIRLKTNLNVPQLSYLFKLLMDVKPAIFNIKTNKELYDFINANFSTKGLPDVGPSASTLNNLYSDVDKSTANFWVERLKKMLEDARNI